MKKIKCNNFKNSKGYKVSKNFKNFKKDDLNAFFNSNELFIRKGKNIYTKNMFKSVKVYGERLFYFKGFEFREWNPYKSKLCASIVKSDFIDFDLLSNSNILYLGASCGTTVSHISDLNYKKIFSVEISYEMGIQLVGLSRTRKNIFPIIEDARNVLNIKKLIGSNRIGLVILDIPGKFQVDLINDIAIHILKKHTIIYFSIKLSSINSSKSLREILNIELVKLKEIFDIKNIISLEPFEKNHYMLILRKK
ncbi:MAG: fibrillarin-like rRNA/tRNA 2'-O-methyltransferase [Nanoarchaeales archaeon]|nr:fibrillarin-like rRNA/tRNA 2'-O-methyltransferase [Nanoarchaeales archaeon]